MKNGLRYIQLLITLLTTVVVSVALYRLLKTNIIPMKFILAGLIAVIVVMILFIFFSIFKKTPVVVRIIIMILEVALIVGALFGLNYLNQGTKFIEKITVAEDIPEQELSVTEKPFTVFIGGVDKSDKLNDVNMIMTINPKTSKILLVAIPRDYYVPFHNTGVKDKLTHSAEWMGADVNNTIATVRDFMGIDLDYYIRVNFAAIEKLVDTIGGIDIYSEKAFRSTTMPECSFTKGMNHVNGHYALAFSRERKSYGEGDLHRVENQTIVLEAIISKLSDHSTFVKYYQQLLDTASEVLKTNFREEDIYNFVNFILDESPSWKVERYRLNGTHIFNIPSPYNNNDLTTMIDPDWNSVEVGKAKILELLSE